MAAILACGKMESNIFWLVMVHSLRKYIAFIIPKKIQRKYTRNLTNIQKATADERSLKSPKIYRPSKITFATLELTLIVHTTVAWQKHDCKRAIQAPETRCQLMKSCSCTISRLPGFNLFGGDAHRISLPSEQTRRVVKSD